MKTLVYLPKNALSPRGGPLASGYYIALEAERSGCHDISFLDSPEERSAGGKGIWKWVNSFLGLFLWPGRKSLPQFLEYDAIHFHTTRDLFAQRKSLRRFPGKVLLTSHSPVPLALEMHAAIRRKLPFRLNWLLKLLTRMDEYAFCRADYILFPCPEAEEPYLAHWPEYARIREQKASAYRYVLTGIAPRQPRREPAAVRREIGAADGDFLLCYVGRHDEIKGYDVLRRMGETLFRIHDDVKIVVAGKEAPLRGLAHPHWIEVGYTTDPYSYMAAADVFLLPNKETYFDLVMIEALSLGSVVIASRTGGNKFYQLHDVPGVLLYDTVEEALSLIETVRAMPPGERQRLGQANLDFYRKHLTSEAFFADYCRVLAELEGGT